MKMINNCLYYKKKKKVVGLIFCFDTQPGSNQQTSGQVKTKHFKDNKGTQ